MYLSSYILPLKTTAGLLLLNGLNGHLHFVKEDFWNKLTRKVKGNDPLVKSLPGVSVLKERFFLFDNKQEEQLMLEKLCTACRKGFKKYKQKKELFFSISFSEDCNLSCPYCLNGTRRTKLRMSKKRLEKVFSALEEFKKNGTKETETVTLFGGEPLMMENYDLVGMVLKRARSVNGHVFTITNGVTIEKYLPLFKEYKKFISGFQITLDGPSTVHDRRRIGKDYPKTFNLISKNIDRLLNSGLSVNLRTNLDKTNLPHLPQLADHIVNRGWLKKNKFRCYLGLVSNSCAESCFQNPRAQSAAFVKQFLQMSKGCKSLSIYSVEDLYSRALKYLDNILKGKSNSPIYSYCMTCGASSLNFAADGKMYSCLSAVGIKDFCFGSYDPVLKWNQENKKKWRYRLSFNMTKCRKCPLIFICGGLCPLNGYEKTGSVYEPNCENAFEELQKFVNLKEKEIEKLLLKKVSQKSS